MTNKMATIGKMERNLFYIFFAATVLFLSAYLYLVNQSVFNIVARKQAEEKIGELRMTVAGIEAEYLSIAKQEITPDNAYALGFKDISEEQTYARAKRSVTLSMASNEL